MGYTLTDCLTPNIFLLFLILISEAPYQMEIPFPLFSLKQKVTVYTAVMTPVV